MYHYDHHDQSFVEARAREFRNQVERRLAGQLTEDEFKPLRLQNGLYLQLHAYMLRVAIPYGELNSQQLRKLGYIADTYDKGYGHFTTRQNIQFNWPKLVDTPDILDHLADVQMHAIQTSGNCIRNVTSDPFAGVAADEFIDPRPVSELMRQWSMLHPEFAFLPRKFKIAVCASEEDRAAIHSHRDAGQSSIIGGAVGFEVLRERGMEVERPVRHFLCRRAVVPVARQETSSISGRRRRYGLAVDDRGPDAVLLCEVVRGGAPDHASTCNDHLLRLFMSC